MVGQRSDGFTLESKCSFRTKFAFIVLVLVLVQYLGSGSLYAYCNSLMISASTEFRGNFSNRSFGDRVVKESPESLSGTMVTALPKPLCPILSPYLKGHYKIQTEIPDIVKSKQQQSHLLPGGRYKPDNCTARHRVAIIIPYRDRELHLKTLLQNLHPFLQRQQLDYGIYVIELEPSVKFNRAMLMNIGFVEATIHYDYQCYIFHDVDLIPEDDRNLYTCPESPRHMSAGIDKYNYRPKYKHAFGGATAIKRDQFLETNGFSNMYFGWGYEDDDFYRRVLDSNLTAVRYSNSIARYKMLKHEKDTPNPYRLKLQKSVEVRRTIDGLNTLKYEVLKREERPLYTWIYVSINRTEIMTGKIPERSPDHTNHTKHLISLIGKPPEQQSNLTELEQLKRFLLAKLNEVDTSSHKHIKRTKKMPVPKIVSWLPTGK